MVDIKQETEPLLSSSTTGDKVHSNRHFFLLTVIGCVHFAAFAALSPIQQFYVIGETAKKFGQHETSYDTYCNATNNANNTSNKVQEESASILTFLTFFSTALAVIPILVLGSLTDRYGRKIPLLISLSGLLAKEVVMLVTVYEGLSLWYLVVGEIFLGLTGHFGLALAAMMGMIADMTKAGRERAIKITILEAVVASSVAIANLGIGFWIKDGNYKHPLVMSVSLSIVSIILTAWCLPETHTNANRTSSSVFSKEMIKAFVKLYRKDKRRPILIVGQVIFCVNVGALLGKANVVTLYLLNHPLCWSEVHVQVFSCITSLVNWITIVLGLRLLHKYMKDSALVVMGTVSGLISLIALALARHDYVVYMSAVMGIFAMANSPMLRSMLSRIVQPDEQGSMFACLGSSELLLVSLAGLAYGLIYKDTVRFFAGFVFLVMAGLVAVEVFLAVLLYRMISKEPPSVTSTVVEVS